MHNLYDQKKGQGMQFNWIFVVVSGAIILVFFAGFGIKYIELEKSKENAQIARSIDNIINGLKGQEQYKTIDISNSFNFEFRCDSFNINNDYQQKLNSKIIFASSNIRVNKLYAWTKEFKKAYKVDNLVYLIDANRQYFLIKDGNEDYVNELFIEIPSEFSNIRKISMQELENLELKGKNNEFVFFKEPSEDDLNAINAKGTIIVIDTFRGLARFGQESYKIIDTPLVFGAIFSGSLESYKCSYDSLKEKFSTINNIYIKKAGYLQGCCSVNNCDYTNARQELLSLNIESNSDNLKLVNDELYNSGCKVIF